MNSDVVPLGITMCDATSRTSLSTRLKCSSEGQPRVKHCACKMFMPADVALVHISRESIFTLCDFVHLCPLGMYAASYTPTMILWGKGFRVRLVPQGSGLA